MAFGQESYEVAHPLEDDQKIYQAYEENFILKLEIENLKLQIENLKEKIAIKDQLIALEEKKSEVYKSAYEVMKELLDQALKLSKKTPLDQILEWVIRIGLFALGFFLATL
jgi:hypothetical protein